MAHMMDATIRKAWLGKTVKQVRDIAPAGLSLCGRVSVVIDVMFDEKGACHIQTEDGYWCPANLLDEVE